MPKNVEKIVPQKVLNQEVDTVIFSGSLPLFTEDENFQVRLHATKTPVPPDPNAPTPTAPAEDFHYATTVTLKKSDLANLDEETIKAAALAKAGLSVKASAKKGS